MTKGMILDRLQTCAGSGNAAPHIWSAPVHELIHETCKHSMYWHLLIKQSSASL